MCVVTEASANVSLLAKLQTAVSFSLQLLLLAGRDSPAKVNTYLEIEDLHRQRHVLSIGLQDGSCD